MSDRPHLNVVKLDDLRRKVSWFFYGTRTFGDLDSDSQAVVDEIINDGYERFLSPPATGNERSPHRWNFLRPYMNISVVEDQEDYALPSNFGGLDGPLYYQRSDGKSIPIAKTDPSRIQMLRMRDALTVTSYPTEYAVKPEYPHGQDQPVSTLMLWPTPGADYTLKCRYFLIAGNLTDENQYPACDAYHNQTLTESCLAVAEERLEDQQGLHSQNFLRLLESSVSYDRDKYSADFFGFDQDSSDERIAPTDYRLAGAYTTYNGYTPGSS